MKGGRLENVAGVETCSQDAKARLRERELLLCRMVPLVENNFNYCELGPGVRENPIFIRKCRRTVSLYPAARPRWPIFSIIWPVSR